MKVTYLKDEFGNVDKDYTITEEGSYIINNKTGKKIFPLFDNVGYRVIYITINGNRYSAIGISKIQWWAWKGLIPKGNDIHHSGKDRYGKFDKTNNHIDLLKCLTRYNHLKIHKSGKNNPCYGRTGNKNPLFGMTGEMHSQAILTKLDIRKMFFLRYIKNLTQIKIANELNVTIGCIGHILNGRRWNPNNLTKDQLKNNFLKKHKEKTPMKK